MCTEALTQRRARGAAPINIRKAAEDDVPALLALHRAALRGLSRGYYSEAQIDSILRHIPTLDDTLISDRSYFVAESDGELVSCGGWSDRVPGYAGAIRLDRSNGEHPPALIRAMYTHPRFARRGLGRRILAAAEAEARRAGRTEIALDALLAGLPLYLAAGYRPVRRQTVAMPDGEQLPLVHMRKRIVEPALAQETR